MKLPLSKTFARQSANDAVVPVSPAEVAPHFQLGRQGEQLAVEHLKRAGYLLVAGNVKLPVGRNTRGVTVNAEIDIVAYDGPTLCFVEVKTRASDEFAPPQVNVDLRKRRQVARAARAYRRMLGLMGASYRYDVITIVLPPEQSGELPGSGPRIELLKSFWTDAALRKRAWSDARWD